MARSLKPLGPGTARFSSCATWRYELTRDLTGYPRPADQFPPKGVLVSIGLNPSTATCDDDDPTVHKESFYTVWWGYARFIKLNAYAYCTTYPSELFEARDRGVNIVGPENDATIRRALQLVRRQGGRLLVAWGGNIEPERQKQIARLVGDDAYCIKANRDGTPFHTCYARNDAKPVRWRCPA